MEICESSLDQTAWLIAPVIPMAALQTLPRSQPAQTIRLATCICNIATSHPSKIVVPKPTTRVRTLPKVALETTTKAFLARLRPRLRTRLETDITTPVTDKSCKTRQAAFSRTSYRQFLLDASVTPLPALHASRIGEAAAIALSPLTRAEAYVLRTFLAAANRR